MVDFESKRFRERYAKCVIGQAYFLAGCGFAFSGLMIPKLDKEVLSLDNATAWIATSGILLRPLVSGIDLFMIDIIGRQSTLRLKILFVAAGWIITTASSNQQVFYFGRMITSLGLGFTSDNSAYLLETDLKWRISDLESFSNSFTTAGIVCSNLLQYFLSWRTASFVIATFSCLVLLQIHYIPETKYWYMMKNRRREAIVSFLWFEKDKSLPDIQEELNKIERTTLNTSNANLLEIFRNSAIIKPLVIYSLTVAARISTGYLIFIHYSAFFFKSFKAKYDVAKLTVFVVIFNFAFTMLFPAVMGKYKRKTIFRLSSMVMMSAMGVLIIYHFGVTLGNMRTFIWLPVTCLLVYTTTNVAFFNPVVSIMLSEIIPQTWRMYATMLQCSIEYKLSVALMFSFPSVVASYGIEFVYWVFLLSTAISYIVIVYFLRTISSPLQYESVLVFENGRDSMELDRRELLQSVIDEQDLS